MNLLGDVIAKARAARGLRQKEVAAKVGIARSYLSQIENNYITTGPKEELLARLASVLEQDKDKLCQLARLGALLKASDMDIRSQDLLLFNCLSHYLQKVERSVKIRSFSCLTFLLILQKELLAALARGVAIQVLLAKPTLPNIYARAWVADLPRPEKTDDWINLIFHYQLRLEAARSLLKTIWAMSGDAGSLTLHLFEPYAPKQFFIFDDEVAIEQKEIQGIIMAVKGVDSQDFQRIAQRFSKEWKEQSSSYDWNQPRAIYVRLPNKAEVQSFLKAQKIPRKRGGER